MDAPPPPQHPSPEPPPIDIPPIDAPPTQPGAVPPPPRNRVNIPGLIGLILCATAAIASPTGVLGFTLCLLLPLGGAGLILSFIGCFFKPRWYGIAGLIVGLICVLGWAAVIAYGVRGMGGPFGPFGLGATPGGPTAISCAVLVNEVETIRTNTGSIPTTFTSTSGQIALDQWGRPYRYTLTTGNFYGYTFIGDGPDGVSGTADDVDLIAIHPANGAFPLPPPPPAPPLAPPAPAGAP